MKKSLLGLLLAVSMAVPAFAAKGDMSINAKLGLGVDTSVRVSASRMGDFGYGIKPDMPFMLGAEFFYGTSDMFSVGLGANYVFDTEADFQTEETVKVKGGTTNIYLAVKPEFKVESNLISSVYLIGQFGLSFGRSEAKANGHSESFDLDSGIYLGAGFGTMIKDAFFVELIFSSCNGEFTIEGTSVDIRYSITSVNVGYKFNI
ncbi:outer membrane beta-barrel protein [Candidatus Ruminimicrobiellum ovillum]|uniref:outer membrane beta-barrel protein n=1 Tax=Candidatus Ruminimicrobiellum ovillum TaxID=1947927 RepID=UPI00355AB1D8